MGTRMLSPSSVRSIVNRFKAGQLKPYLVLKGDKEIVSFMNPDNLTVSQRNYMVDLELHELITIIGKTRRRNLNAWLVIMQLVRDKII